MSMREPVLAPSTAPVLPMPESPFPSYPNPFFTFLEGKSLKLFVWTNVWDGGIAVALAEDYQQAVEMIENEYGPHVARECLPSKVQVIDRPFVIAQQGRQ